MNKKEAKFNAQMEKYRAGIVEDLEGGRDITAIICGYGFIYEDDYNEALNWVRKNIRGDV